MLPAATNDVYRANRRRVLRLLIALRSEWARLTPSNDWDAVWREAGPRITGMVTLAQQGAALDGAASVPVALRQTGATPAQVAQVNAAAFGGVASDGRPLGSLLGQSLIQARQAVGTAEEMLLAGRTFLDMAAHMQVLDASRAASSVAITATRGAGWVRMVNPPCCQDCAILAGKWFRWNQGFERHPGCDCIHRPAMGSEPRAGYTQEIAPTDIKDLTQAQRQALAEGADLNRVVNAYRGQIPGRRARMFTTSEAARGKLRLTPEGIYTRAGGDRDKAVGLLREFGYLR